MLGLILLASGVWSMLTGRVLTLPASARGWDFRQIMRWHRAASAPIKPSTARASSVEIYTPAKIRPPRVKLCSPAVSNRQPRTGPLGYDELNLFDVGSVALCTSLISVYAPLPKVHTGDHFFDQRDVTDRRLSVETKLRLRLPRTWGELNPIIRTIIDLVWVVLLVQINDWSIFCLRGRSTPP
jgi:hypothetical protein